MVLDKFPKGNSGQIQRGVLRTIYSQMKEHLLQEKLSTLPFGATPTAVFGTLPSARGGLHNAVPPSISGSSGVASLLPSAHGTFGGGEDLPPWAQSILLERNKTRAGSRPDMGGFGNPSTYPPSTPGLDGTGGAGPPHLRPFPGPFPNTPAGFGATTQELVGHKNSPTLVSDMLDQRAMFEKSLASDSALIRMAGAAAGITYGGRGSHIKSALPGPGLYI